MPTNAHRTLSERQEAPNNIDCRSALLYMTAIKLEGPLMFNATSTQEAQNEAVKGVLSVAQRQRLVYIRARLKDLKDEREKLIAEREVIQRARLNQSAAS